LIIYQDSYIVYPGIAAIAQSEINYMKIASKRQNRFGPSLAEDIHSLAAPSGQNKG